MEAEIQGVAVTQQGAELHGEKARPGREEFKGSGRRVTQGEQRVWSRGGLGGHGKVVIRVWPWKRSLGGE